MIDDEKAARLKRKWLTHPVWSADKSKTAKERHETAEAFHEARDAVFSESTQDEWEAMAAQIGVPNNYMLAAYILYLEKRIAALEEKLR